MHAQIQKQALPASRNCLHFYPGYRHKKYESLTGGRFTIKKGHVEFVDNHTAGGDVISREVGSQMATPVGSQDGDIAAHNAFAKGEQHRVNHRVIPRTIFTDPQIATVGMTEEEAISAGHNCWCNVVPMSLVPRAGVIRDTAGMIKMVADGDTEEVLGVAIVGHTAGEVIHKAAMGLRFHAKISDFINLLHVYPTMSEALKIVAISRRKDPAKLSCSGSCRPRA